VHRREILDEEHIRDERRSRVCTLDQIVTEDPVLGEAVMESGAKRIDIVDALADERALVEDILINVGDRARVRIDPGIAAEQAREA
jgi:hypothetical protein